MRGKWIELGAMKKKVQHKKVTDLLRQVAALERKHKLAPYTEM